RRGRQHPSLRRPLPSGARGPAGRRPPRSPPLPRWPVRKPGAHRRPPPRRPPRAPEGRDDPPGRGGDPGRPTRTRRPRRRRPLPRDPPLDHPRGPRTPAGPAPPADISIRENPPMPPRPLDVIFQPRSIAVVGASRRRDSIGFALLHNLVLSEFNGAIYPVNPNAQVIHSLKCYPDLVAIPDPVDLAVILVPRQLVQGVVEACIAKGVGGLAAIPAGFAETGPEGAAREERLRDAVRAAGVRMIGPNCMGVINTAADVSLNATFAPTPARPGSLGFVSQSGALGVAILN